MKVKEKKILKSLKEIYSVESVKYDVLSKSFVYNFPQNNTKSITFDTLLNTMENSHDIYNTLESLRDSYFPRRLKEVIVTFYELHNLELPNQLLLGEDGFELEVDGKVNFVQYDDDFTIFLEEFANLYNTDFKGNEISPRIEDYEGHYHK